MAAAKDFFPVLKTLVVPILPEPTFLISFPKKIFVIINPNGIDPKNIGRMYLGTESALDGAKH